MQENWKHLESNLEMRKSSKSWNVVEKNVVPLLSEITDENENQLFTRDDIHLAAGVLDTNCFQVKSKEQVSGLKHYLKRIVRTSSFLYLSLEDAFSQLLQCSTTIAHQTVIEALWIIELR